MAEFGLLWQVAWVRVDTQTILTIDDVVITRNARISVRHTADAAVRTASQTHPPHQHHIPHIRKTWQLVIRDVHTSDGGAYMCQLNTEPMTSQTAYLTVTGNQRVNTAITKRHLRRTASSPVHSVTFHSMGPSTYARTSRARLESINFERDAIRGGASGCLRSERTSLRLHPIEGNSSTNK